MSFTSFSLLLLFIVLLCISLHSCDASRRLSDRPDDKFHISNPNEEKSVSVSTAAKVLEDDQSSSKMGETDDKILKDKKESKVVTVTWRVPHNKAEEEHPGYNLDYSPPKTHPPSHN